MEHFRWHWFDDFEILAYYSGQTGFADFLQLFCHSGPMKENQIWNWNKSLHHFLPITSQVVGINKSMENYREKRTTVAHRFRTRTDPIF